MASVSNNRITVLMNALRLGEGAKRHLGGNFHHVARLSEALAARDDVSLTLLTDRSSSRELMKICGTRDITYVHAEDMGTKDTLSVWEADTLISDVCRELMPDVYHRATGQLPLRRLKCATVATIPDLNYRHMRRGLIRRIYKEVSFYWTLRSATRITAVSNFTKQQIQQYYKIPESRVSVIYHGAAMPEHSRTVLRKLPLSWVTFGHQPHKNVEVCIKAIARRRKLGISETLFVVGESEHIDLVLRPMAAALDVSHSVNFVGRVSENELNTLYFKASALLFMSRYEGFGLPIVEAMSAGTAVICSNTCSLPEIAGQAAIILDPDDVDGLCDAMESITTDDTMRERLTEIGYIRAKEFTWERAAAKTVDVYRDAIRNYKK